MGGKLIYQIEELTSDSLRIAGKKCANLGEMTRIGLPVPPGYALSVDCYNRFMEESGAIEAVRRYLTTHHPDSLHGFAGYEAVASDLREIVEAFEVPEDIAGAIRSEYDALCRRCGIPEVAVAVRSSGPVSLPGQFETYLNVRGRDEVVRQVRRVWGSTFTTQALAGRVQKGLPLESSPIGVAILKMVHSKSAGVAFTVDPVSGDGDLVVIEGTWGLGESVVGGIVAPDRFVVEKEGLRTVETRINSKHRQMIYKNNGTGWVDVPDELREKACLEEFELRRLGELCKLVESHYRHPQDIEWAIDADLEFPDNVFLVQTRNVTAVSPQGKTPAAQYIADLMMRAVFNR